MPGRAASAPVKAPRSWPKNCASNSDEAKAAALTGMKGLPARVPSWWTARATNSFPVPLSPRISTLLLLRAIRSTSPSVRMSALSWVTKSLKTSRKRGPAVPSAWSWCSSPRRREPSRARSRQVTSRSLFTGLQR